MNMIEFKEQKGFIPLICLDAGHGSNTPGKRTPVFEDGSFIKENEFNRAVVMLIKPILEKIGFKTILVAHETTDTDLEIRTSRANNAVKNYRQQWLASNIGNEVGIYVSVHYNALTGTWDSKAKGVETFHLDSSVDGKRLAQCIHGEVLKGTKQVDRGVKTANFWVLRKTVMPACLVECGFMDNKREALLMKDEKFKKETAEDIVRGICKYYGISFEVAEEIKSDGADWQKKALADLVGKGVIESPKYWEDRLNDKITIGEVLGILAKM